MNKKQDTLSNKEHDPFREEDLQQSRELVQLTERETQKKDEADLRWLMKSRRGRRIAWRILERAGVFRLSFSSDAMAMAFAEGCKNEGLKLLDSIHQVCPELYTPMIRENNGRDKSN